MSVFDATSVASPASNRERGGRVDRNRRKDTSGGKLNLRLSRGKSLIAAAVLATMLPVTPAKAFCATNVKWTPTAVGYQPQDDEFSASALTAIEAAGNQWNGANSGFVFSYHPPSASGPFSMYVRRPSFKNKGFPDIPGRTVWKSGSTNRLISVKVFLNDDWGWNTSGTMSQKNRQTDVRTVTLHEMGHALVLAHPQECGMPISSAETDSVMNVQYKKKWNVNSDDINGIRAIY
jgi:hypothetical protein